MQKKYHLNKKGKLFFMGFFLIIVLVFLLFISSCHNRIQKEDENYIIKIDYPELENKKEYRKVAMSIKNYIEEKKSEFIATVKNLENKEITYEFQVASSLNTYEGITSINIQIYSYTGGAHYARDDKSFYFIEKNGEVIDLKHFLKDGDSIEKLSQTSYEYIMKYMNKNELNFREEDVKEGTKPLYENFSHFSFRQNGLELLFPPYQVASWADGEIRITIPYKDLIDIVKGEYIKKDEKPVDEPIETNKRSLEEFKDKKLIAFTFDDGPSNIPTNKLLDSLDKYDARVTFFVLGSRVNQYKDSLSRAYLQGNQIGSHTYSHLNLLKLNEQDITREIKNTNSEIKNIIGIEPTVLRPPYGNTNTNIKELSDMYTILWDIDPEDWKYKDANKVALNITEHAHDGAIVILHDIYETSVDGALIAMEKLKEEGYAFVTIDEMMTLKNVEPDKTKSYYNLK